MALLAPWLGTTARKAFGMLRGRSPGRRRSFASACKLRGHKINRNRIWYDQLNFRTNCERCGFPMIRDVNGWRAFDTSIDSNTGRIAHPGAGN